MTDKEAFSWHSSRVLFRRNRIKKDSKVFDGIVELIGQYAEQLKDKSAEYVANATKRCLQLHNAGVKSEYKWNREITVRYIHHLLLQEI